MEWVIFALLSSMFGGVANLVDKYVISGLKVPPYAYLIAGWLLGSLVVLFMLPISTITAVPPAVLARSVIIGILFIFGVTFYLKALEIEEISRISTLWLLVPVYVIPMSFFLGERLAVKSYAGIALLLIGGFFVSLKHKGSGVRLGKAFYLLLAATFFGALFNIVMKMNLDEGVPVVDNYILLRLGTIIAASRDRKAYFAIGLVALLIGPVIWLTLNMAAQTGPISAISAFTVFVPAFVLLYILGFRKFLPQALKENLSFSILIQKAAALIIMTAGVLLIYL
ncbi:EamA family transporter [Candidatus Woesearchaeota archaeon]|nr:EamA family transporter [Candidatus Woesearchaeota archaeon]